MKKVFFLLLSLSISTAFAATEEVGKFTIGHEKFGITTVSGVVTALNDSKVKGVTCHVVTVTKSMAFTDPSNASIACRQVGAIVIGKINKSPKGENVTFTGASKTWLGNFFKDQKIRRIYDQENNTLVYVAYTTKVIKGSYKISVSTISLYSSK